MYINADDDVGYSIVQVASVKGIKVSRPARPGSHQLQPC